MKTVLLLLFLVTSAYVADAQTTPVDTTTGKPYYILLKDGSHIQGRIIKRDNSIYTVQLKNGQLTYVEKSVFSKISSFAPVTADSAAYFTGSNYSRPNTTQPNQTTATPSQYVVTLLDGTTLNGQVLSQDANRLVLKTTTIGTVYVPAEQVVRMERVVLGNSSSDRRNLSSVVDRNLFPQYLNFLPTAYQAEKGRVYFRNSSVYISQFDIGLTDNWSVGGNFFTFIPILFGSVATKVSTPLGPRIRIGLQAQLIYGELFDRVSSTGLFLGVVSIGETQNNVTIGLGTSTNPKSFGQVLSVSVVRSLKPSLTFISENLILAGNGGLSLGKLGAGIRLNRARHSFDISLNIPFGPDGITSGSDLVLFPSASYQIRMGR